MASSTRSFGAKDHPLINKLLTEDFKARHELEYGLGGLPESLRQRVTQPGTAMPSAA